MGGAFIVMPLNKLRLWQGSNSKGENGFSDYERACNVTDYLGLLEVDGTSCLVLADEPLMTTWYQITCNKGFLFRWVYGSSIAEVERHFPVLTDHIVFENNELLFKVNSQKLCLFDSALTSLDANFKSICFELNIGSYKIKTGFFEPNSSTKILVHELSQA